MDEKELAAVRRENLRKWMDARDMTGSQLAEKIGSAMEPYLQAGDSVMIDVGQVGIRDGDVYAIRHGGDMRLRRLFITVDGGVQLRSDNPTHPSETLPCDAAAKLGVIGRVIWRAG